ncbi:MAG: DUF2219 family protein [Sphingobacteriales bacterium]|nr:MAG: DUF2219 family protein [Sphingobacteriales bacterium]
MERNILLLSIFLLCHMTAFAQTLYTDEDLEPLLKLGSASDRDYTMGLSIGPRGSNPNSLIFKPGSWITKKLLGKHMPNRTNLLEFTMPWTINGTAFTPDDLTSYAPVTNDRPYAFILYLSTKKLYLNVEKHSLFASEFNYGLTGTHIGKWVQTKIHETMNDDDTKDPHTPRGWSNQISNGGELTFLYSLSYEKLITDQRMHRQQERGTVELKHGVKAMIGYYTGAQYQLAGRLGLLDVRNWIRSTNPLGGGDKDIATRAQAEADLNLGKINREEYKRIMKNDQMKSHYSSRRKFELFAFSSIRPTFMLYNELLNGKIRQSAHTFNFKQTQHFMLEWTTGVGLGFPAFASYVNLSWTINAGRTAQFRTDMATKHQWGAVGISIVPK